MLKDLKQFIRVLQQLKSNEKKSQVYILTSNQQYSDLISFFLSRFIQVPIKIKSLFFKEDFRKFILEKNSDGLKDLMNEANKIRKILN